MPGSVRQVLTFFFASCAAITATCATNAQILKVVPKITSQRYCYADTEVFSILLKLQVSYANQTDKTLILDKNIGEAWYSVMVARTTDDLAAGKYEYNPNIDFFPNQKLKRPRRDWPGVDFAVLKPREIFENNIDVGIVAQYENPKTVPGAIRSGTHVLQMGLSAWNHPGKPTDFENSWQHLGTLVSGVVKTEPVVITVPANPKVEQDCK